MGLLRRLLKPRSGMDRVREAYLAGDLQGFKAALDDSGMTARSTQLGVRDVLEGRLWGDDERQDEADHLVEREQEYAQWLDEAVREHDETQVWVCHKMLAAIRTRRAELERDGFVGRVDDAS